ncbi:MAG: hypothetical protein WBG08_12355, partial [Litorimonas sp.]
MPRWLKIAGGLLAGLMLLAGLAALWAWSNRYSLMERQAITYLDSLGIDADLSIHSANGTAADIRDIRLSQNGQRFLSVDRLQAAYQWRDLLNGQAERLEFTGLRASVTLDETGRITDGWMPPSTGSGAGGFPSGGIRVDRAEVELSTPFGPVEIHGDLDMAARDRLSFTGRIEQADLSRDGAALSVSGPVEVEREGGPFTVLSPGLRVDLDHPSGRLTGTRLAVNAEATSGSAQGTAELTGGRFTTPQAIGGEIGAVSVAGRWAEGAVAADIDIDLRDTALGDADRRRELARTLSLADALSEVPVAQNFAPSLVAPVQALLSGSDVQGSMSVQLSEALRTLSVRTPLRLSEAQPDGARTPVQAVLDAVPDMPFYRYAVGSGGYDMATQVTLNRPLPVELTPLRVRIASEDGISVDGVRTATGRIETQGQWRSRTRQGRPARLGPLGVAFDYDAPPSGAADSARRLTLRGAADYDGDVPGGYVQGLRAGGTLTSRLRETGLEVAFDPNRPLRFAALETPSDWIVTAFEGRLRPNGPLFAKHGTNPARIRTGLADARFTAARPATQDADAAELSIQVDRADLSGSVAERTQDWSVSFTNMGLQSETFPVAGTDLVLPGGTLDVALSQDARTRFIFAAPDSRLETPGYIVRGMA